MMKKLVAVAVLSAVPFTAFADNDAGCGVGTQIWKGQKGLLPKVLAATTNGTFYNTISMTFGVLGCSSDGVVTASARMPMYAGANLDQLAAEMAAGEGEALANLASLYGIEEADRAAFYQLTQANFASIFASEDATAGDVLHNVSLVLAADQRLARYLA